MSSDVNIVERVKKAKESALNISVLSEDIKNDALKNIADAIEVNREKILKENKKDIEASKDLDISDSLKKRLVLDNKKIDTMIFGLIQLRVLENPTDKILFRKELDSGLILEKITVPIGLIGVIFESRPDVLVQIAGLAVKSGNAVVLKGGKEAYYTNKILFDIVYSALKATNPIFSNSLVLANSRDDIKEILSLDDYIDLMIPRGSNDLVKFIKNNTKISVLGHSDGICHVYVDKYADLEKAIRVVYDSKCQYPAVCNAMETLLVNREIAKQFLPMVVKKLNNVELRGCEESCEIVSISRASEDDWKTEYNDYILSIKIIDSVEDAVEFINRFGSHHTDSIVTEDRITANFFTKNVDSASVFYNCSTRFSDGFRYGFGAEVGISTNKIHARGPVGLDGLTTYKYILKGSGDIVEDYVNGKKSFKYKEVGEL